MIKTTEHKKDRVKDMFEAGVHFGYAKSRRHPSTAPFILGRKDGVEIFDLEKVQQKLDAALEFVAKIASEGKQILFVGGKSEVQNIVKEIAEKIEMPYVAGRWIGGTLTNFPQIRKRIDHFVSLTEQRDKGLLAKYTKKERLLIDREIAKLETAFSGIVNMPQKPGVMFIIDTDKEKNARAEAVKENVPIIGLCSSDCDVKDIDYVIPGNDSSRKSVSYFMNIVANHYKENKGKKAGQNK